MISFEFFWIYAKSAANSQSFRLGCRFEGPRTSPWFLLMRKLMIPEFDKKDQFEKSAAPSSHTSGLERRLWASKCNPERQPQFCKWLVTAKLRSSFRR